MASRFAWSLGPVVLTEFVVECFLATPSPIRALWFRRHCCLGAIVTHQVTGRQMGRPRGRVERCSRNRWRGLQSRAFALQNSIKVRNILLGVDVAIAESFERFGDSAV
jgi:hypothetical protein